MRQQLAMQYLASARAREVQTCAAGWIALSWICLTPAAPQANRNGVKAKSSFTDDVSTFDAPAA
jgi:hypothetical protein